MIRSVRSVRGLIALVLAMAGLLPTATSARASGSMGIPIRFADTKSFKTGASPQQVASADFDGNGTLDLLTSNQGTHMVSLLRGRGDGTFHRAESIRAGVVHPLAIATADMNGDGHADAVLVNGLVPNHVAVLLGNGAGGFHRSTFHGGHRSQWVITADLNDDGVPDVGTANAGGGVSVLLGKGDGTLGRSVDYSTKSTMCSALAAADLDEDGHLDLITTNSVLGNGASNHSISVLLGRGDGTFRAPAVYRHLGYQPTMPATADVNGDGHLDVIAPMGGWPGHYVTVLFGTGNGTLHHHELLLAGPSAHDTVAVDLNGDGTVDLASSCLGTSYVVPTNQGVAIRSGRGDGTFGPVHEITDAWPTTTWKWPTWLGAADLNGDGRVDLVAPDELNSTVGVLINRS